jgi:V/A-type H+-transporting ATPase subunit A
LPMPDTHIIRLTGALAEARPMAHASLYELAQVGRRRLLSEVIRLEGDTGTLQVYEETSGLTLGEPVTLSGHPLTVQLGPGLLGSILDGVGRPLTRLGVTGGDFIEPGAAAPTLDPDHSWMFEPALTPGAYVAAGDVLGTTEERPGIRHRVLVHPGAAGTLIRLEGGARTVQEPVGELDDGTQLFLAQRWSVRLPRPVAERLSADEPLVTGQRIFDLLFPIPQGGTVAVPGGFGTGKTVIEQSLAKYAAADIVVFIGCGERGNEMADVLNEFPRLIDPHSGQSIMDRTVLVVNTSNMPVAAREASVYLGMTIAEYYRDMGFRVAVMADSLSRWAEALREMGARLQEMPGEEGYPTYLGNRLGKLFERAGRARVQGRPERTGALTFVGAISPPGGDFSEPVTQASLRVAGALWALDADLAHQRQFPAVDWETSYSLYTDVTDSWFAAQVGADWPALRRETIGLLQREHELRDIAGLVGPEALQDEDRLVLDAAHTVRELVLSQSAYDPHDAMSGLEKTHLLAALARDFFQEGRRLLAAGVPFDNLDLRAGRHAIAGVRAAPAPEVAARAEAAAAAIRAMHAPTGSADEPTGPEEP